jgi:hypothetical protein
MILPKNNVDRRLIGLPRKVNPFFAARAIISRLAHRPRWGGDPADA